MDAKNIDFADMLLKARKESGSETTDLVIEHELRDVTPQMIDWWWQQAAAFYKMWHPKDHVSMRRELVTVKPGTEPIRVSRVIEAIDEFPAVEFFLRPDDPRSSPIPTVYGNSRASSFVDSEYKAYAWLLHDYKAASYGTKMRSTFRFPARTPEQFLKAMRKHNQEEMGQLPVFLPELYKKENLAE